MTSRTEKLVFASTWQKNAGPIGEGLAKFLEWLSSESGIRISNRAALSYQELAEMLRTGGADIAWLPPIVYAKLEREGIVVPIASHERAAIARYESVLIVRKKSQIRELEDLRDTRVGWVDRWSASGFVLPRIALFARGIDPRGLFAEERFYGSHDSAVRALLGERADAVAAFARADDSGEHQHGSWSEIEGAADRVRVLVAFGSLPADVTAAHSSLDDERKGKIARALEKASSIPEIKKLIDTVFGIERFKADGLADYDGLRRALESAYACGLIDERVVR
ncbi:MAG: PhnD/SsuA/transferrin family substrate-binding protein [Polyangiaceae bacterium]